MERKHALSVLSNIYEVYGEDTNGLFKSAITKTIFTLQNKTNDSCTKEDIKEVSEMLQQLYHLFDFKKPTNSSSRFNLTKIVLVKEKE